MEIKSIFFFHFKLFIYESIENIGKSFFQFKDFVIFIIWV